MARPSRLLAAIGITCAVSCAHETPAPVEPEALVESGRVLFEQHCALCHGPAGDGRGLETLAPQPAAVDLTRIAARGGGEFDAGEVARFIDGRTPIEAHRSEMPVWGDGLSVEVRDWELREEVTRGRISALVAYLRTLQVPAGERQ